MQQCRIQESSIMVMLVLGLIMSVGLCMPTKCFHNPSPAFSAKLYRPTDRIAVCPQMVFFSGFSCQLGRLENYLIAGIFRVI